MDPNQAKNIRFDELVKLLGWLGIELRSQGTSHHVASYRDELVNIKLGKGGKAIPYQVGQIREMIARFGLSVK